MEPSAALVLDYAATDGAADRPLPLLLRVAFFLVAVGAAVSPFLPFAHEISPWDTIPLNGNWSEDVELTLVGLPFFAGCVALIWKLRRLGPPTHSIERVTAAIVALLFSGATAAFLIRAGTDAGMTLWEWFSIAIAPLILVFGTVLLVWFKRKRRPDDAALVALCTAYAANAVMCLIIFWGSRNPGWLLTAAVTLGMFSEAVTTVAWTARHRR
jgi:hypothetical protein